MTLPELSAHLADAAERALRAVVRVRGRRGYPLSGTVLDERHVVTTARAAPGDEATVDTAAEDGLAAEVVGRDPRTDLALLRLEAGGLEPPDWRDGDDLRVAELVLRLGRPEAGPAASLGVLRARGGPWRTPDGAELALRLDADASPFPGFSGGPLVDAAGRALGIGTAALGGGAATVPAATVREVAAVLREHGRVPRGYLGLAGRPVRLPARLREAAGQRAGLLVLSVEEDAPADRAGLSLGDVLLTLDGRPVHDGPSVAALLAGERIGRELPLRWLRGGEIREAAVTVRERG